MAALYDTHQRAPGAAPAVRADASAPPLPDARNGTVRERTSIDLGYRILVREVS
jgi:hypothetical protein